MIIDKVGGHIHVAISMLLQKYSQEMSAFSSIELTIATRTMAVIMTTIVTEKIPIRSNFWRKGMRTCQSIRTGIEMTNRMLESRKSMGERITMPTY